MVNDFKCPETQVEKLAYKFMHTHLELASFLTSCLLKLACQGWYGLFVLGACSKHGKESKKIQNEASSYIIFYNAFAFSIDVFYAWYLLVLGIFYA